MQSSAFLNNVRTTASQIPRAISPHLASPTSPISSAASSIRSISPSRHSFQIRSRSASPSPRRFASVLAYHATPIVSPKQQQQQQDESPEQPHHSNQSDHGKDGRNRDESPSRIAVRNLEESWRRFELEAAASPSLSGSSSFGSSGVQSPARVGSPSPLSKPPYKELIECRSLEERVSEDENSTTRGGPARLSHESEETLDLKSRMAKQRPAANRLSSQSISEPKVDNKAGRADQQQQDRIRAAKTTDASSGVTKDGGRATKHEVTDALLLEQQQPQHGFSSTFLASSEARHILDLPSLLGQDPNRISDVLPLSMPYQPQPRSLSTQTSASSSSKLMTNLNAQADATAEAMTERFAAKNLNMTETEAHRMVQILANEVVSLHEEAAKMRTQMEEARRDMLEAARLLRLKAESEQRAHESREMQEYSSSHGQVDAAASAPAKGEQRSRQDEEEMERMERVRVAASSYNKDEWND